jgi:hypothetical protein
MKVDVECFCSHTIVLYSTRFKRYPEQIKGEILQIPAIELFPPDTRYKDVLKMYSTFIVKNYEEKYIRNEYKIQDFMDRMSKSNRLSKNAEKVYNKLIKNDLFIDVIGEKLLSPKRKVIFGLFDLGPSYSQNKLKSAFDKYLVDYGLQYKTKYDDWTMMSEVYSIKIHYKD